MMNYETLFSHTFIVLGRNRIKLARILPQPQSMLGAQQCHCILLQKQQTNLLERARLPRATCVWMFQQSRFDYRHSSLVCKGVCQQTSRYAATRH